MADQFVTKYITQTIPSQRELTSRMICGYLIFVSMKVLSILLLSQTLIVHYGPHSCENPTFVGCQRSYRS